MTTIAETFDDHWKPVPGPLNKPCHVWQRSRDRKGYGHVWVGGKVNKAHRFSWRRKNGSIPRGLCVLHRCDNPPCVNPDHLFLGTNADNVRDRDLKGRRTAPRGELHPKARFTETDVERIRDIRRVGGASRREIARYFQAPLSTVKNILRGRTWKHLLPDHEGAA